MPGVRALEGRLIMGTHANDKELREFKAICAELLVNLFGISDWDTRCYRPPPYDPTMSFDEWSEKEEYYHEYESQFETEKMPW